MSEPSRSRTGMAIIHNPVEQRRQLGITHDDKTIERYVPTEQTLIDKIMLTHYRYFLDRYAETKKRNRKK
jgi:hypothetical protein